MYVWAESSCNHGPLTELEPKTFLTKESVATEKLRAVVFDPKFLANLDKYTKFRHTGGIENFNSTLTKHAPKRIAFEYPFFKCRMALAAIDHNMHANRPQARTKDGRLCFKRKYNKNTRQFHAEPVKVKKSYSYVPYCLARIVNERTEMKDTVLERVSRVPSDPKLVSPNLDLVNKPPPTSQLIQKRKSRIAKKH